MEVTPKEKLSDVLEFIREWLEPGDLKSACEKFKIDRSHGSKILKGKVKKPRVDFLKHLKEKALTNYNKLRV